MGTADDKNMAGAVSSSNREVVNIGDEADALGTAKDARLEDLERLDKENRIRAWKFRERARVVTAVFVISVILATGALLLVFSEDESTRDWARQLLFALLGFAAASIWPSSSEPH